MTDPAGYLPSDGLRQFFGFLSQVVEVRAGVAPARVQPSGYLPYPPGGWTSWKIEYWEIGVSTPLTGTQTISEYTPGP